MAQANLLGDQLGVAYFQTPHNFLRDDALLRTFLDAWPEQIPAVWEFLHPSWHEPEVRASLRRRRVGWVISDAKNPAPASIVTGPDAYVRRRAERYDPTRLGQ